MRKKIGGKIGPGSPANMGHMGKSTAKMMQKSPLEMDTPKKGEGKYDYIDKMGPQVDNTPEGRGQATRTIDKIKSAVQAPFSDKTYADFKKDYRAVQKSKHRKQKQKRQDWLYYHMNRSF
tara:strand:+ start:102 stop:461 length:360 start_codon:yes stop_codon:yes gene_type:complete